MVLMRTTVLLSALAGSVVGLKWSQTKTVLAFGDSYTFVQGTLGHTGYSFWGDRFNSTITKAQVQTNEIVANVTSSDGANWIEMVTGCYSGLPSKCPRVLWNFAFAGADIDPAILTLHHNYTVDLTEQVGQWEQAYRDKLFQAPSTSSMAAFFIGINDTGDTAKWKNITDWTAFWNTELDSYFNTVVSLSNAWQSSLTTDPSTSEQGLPNRTPLVFVPQRTAYGPCSRQHPWSIISNPEL
ncbi:hypothetical protein FRC12_006083 [Ceratobasidium sp. 428]|nr:hypothetical protein FRC12_006083 [Ceratobasidium sp. 428]